MKLINHIRHFGERISRCLSYIPVLWNVYDFDYSSILTVERHQIQRVRDCIKQFHYHENWERNVAEMDLVLRLLDIIEEDGEAEYIGNSELTKQDNGTYILDPNARWEMNRYVNTRNASRFLNQRAIDKFNDPNAADLFKDSLRVKKAWYLYHKLRQEKMNSWWE